MNVSKLAPYAKTVVAVAGFVLMAAKAVADGQLTASEVQELAITAAVALGVYHVPNKG